MSRDDGFAVADVDSAYFDDAKMRDLWQRLQDPDRMARAVALHAATLLSSWRHGERVTVGQASPMWMPHDPDLVAELKAVRLLDRSGRIPNGSWDQWFGAAFRRREARREIGRAGGLASGKSRSTDGEPTVQRNSSASEPDRTVRPSVPPVLADRPFVPTPRARRANEAPPLSRERTTEEVLHDLSDRFQRGELTELEYSRQRKALGAA